MRAFSLRTLLIATAVVALCLVILGRPSLFWTRLTLSATLATLGWWLVVALVTRDDRRRFGIAAATIGIGYLVVSLVGTERSEMQRESYVWGRSLLTHQLLESIGKRLEPGYPVQYQDFSLWDSQMFTQVNYVAVPATGAAAPGGVMGNGGMPGGGFGGGGFGGGNFGGGGFAGPVAFRTVPGASVNARYQYYLISGHCLFSLLLGWLAGCAARRWLKPPRDVHDAAQLSTNA